MKRLTIHTFWILLSFIFLISGYAAAQQQKTGYVDTDLIISNIPEYDGVQQQLRVLSQEWRDELDKMQQEIEQMRKDFQAKEILFTEEIRIQKQEEIQQKVQQRDQYMDSKFGPEGEYFERQKELLEPLQRKIFEAITTVAERGGYDFVFDRSQNATLLYSRSEWNLNEDVLFELGVTPEETSN